MASGPQSSGSARQAEPSVVPIKKTISKTVQVETTTKQSKIRHLRSLESIENETKRVEDELRSATGEAGQEKEERQKQARRASAEAATSGQSRHSGGPEAKKQEQGRQRQMFSLKELARQSRQFATSSKKRVSVQGAGGAGHANNCSNSSSNSDGGSSSATESGGRSARAPDAEPAESSRSRRLAASRSSSNSCCEFTNQKSNNQAAAATKFHIQLEADDSEQELSSLRDCSEARSSDCSSSQMGSSACASSSTVSCSDEDSPPRAGAKMNGRRQRRQARASRRRAQRAPDCEHSDCVGVAPVSWRQDETGERQQVTDVDLVSYKHLCHLESSSCAQCCSQQLLFSHQCQTQPSGASAGSTACRCCSGSEKAGPISSVKSRKLSTERPQDKWQNEADCAYHELCLSREEQLIRHKFAWFPPSLKTLRLVEQFFSYFPEEKVPYRLSERQDSSSDAVAALKERQTSEGSYRDQQVAAQLPRQDISLDYCSSELSEPSRVAYCQFVEKRNSQALDVGTVIELKSIAAQRASTTSGAPDDDPTGRRRRSSLKSASLQPEAPAVHLLPNQRCRRCLVRFEAAQLAVMAPNFVIGTPATVGSLGPAGSALDTSLYQAAAQLAPANTNQIIESQVHRRASTVSITIQPNAATARQARQQASLGGQSSNCALFHPQCFTCSTCKEFLVDLVYCLRDNKLYCLRHYGESLRPRCSWCQEVSSVLPVVCLAQLPPDGAQESRLPKMTDWLRAGLTALGSSERHRLP